MPDWLLTALECLAILALLPFVGLGLCIIVMWAFELIAPDDPADIIDKLTPKR